MLYSAKIKGKGKKGVRGRLVKSWLDKEGEKKVKRKEESIEWKRLSRGSEMEEYDMIKRSLNSEIGTFVFQILCKHLNLPSVWKTERQEGESRIYSNTICPSGVSVDQQLEILKTDFLFNYLTNKYN